MKAYSIPFRADNPQPPETDVGARSDSRAALLQIIEDASMDLSHDYLVDVFMVLVDRLPARDLFGIAALFRRNAYGRRSTPQPCGPMTLGETHERHE